jgi:hypothetical protein
VEHLPPRVRRARIGYDISLPAQGEHGPVTILWSWALTHRGAHNRARRILARERGDNPPWGTALTTLIAASAALTGIGIAAWW